MKDAAPRADLKKPWAAMTKAVGLPGVRIHDLRHSFASIGAGASLGLPIIGKLLGHSQAATRHRYAHLDADPMRRAAETIGATIAAAMGGTASNACPWRKSSSRKSGPSHRIAASLSLWGVCEGRCVERRKTGR
jgi:integrase-like protein